MNNAMDASNDLLIVIRELHGRIKEQSQLLAYKDVQLAGLKTSLNESNDIVQRQAIQKTNDDKQIVELDSEAMAYENLISKYDSEMDKLHAEISRIKDTIEEVSMY